MTEILTTSAQLAAFTFIILFVAAVWWLYKQ